MRNRAAVFAFLSFLGFASLPSASLRAAEPASPPPPAPAAAVVVDPFTVGSVWNGQRMPRKKDGDGKVRASKRIALHIEERKGDTFSGYLVLFGTGENKTKVDVFGSAPADGQGHVSFSTKEDRGDLKLRFSGMIEKEIIQLEFKGHTLAGEDTEGTAMLSRKK